MINGLKDEEHQHAEDAQSDSAVRQDAVDFVAARVRVLSGVRDDALEQLLRPSVTEPGLAAGDLAARFIQPSADIGQVGGQLFGAPFGEMGFHLTADIQDHSLQ